LRGLIIINDKSEMRNLMAWLTTFKNDAKVYISEDDNCTTIKIFKDKDETEIKEYFKGYFNINEDKRS